MGILLTSSLSFSEHINNVVPSTRKTLVFLTRITTGFTDTTALLVLYNALVRSKLVYGSVIWSPYHAYLSMSIERVQHTFLRTAAYRSGRKVARICHDYTTILNDLNLRPLACRRVQADLFFLYKIINGHTEC